MTDRPTKEERSLSDATNASDQYIASIAGPTLHEVWNSETVVFQVESTLFSVLKQGLMVPGSVIADMFALPASSGAEAEGRHISNPIMLHDTKESDFVAFLSAIYPWMGGKKRVLRSNRTEKGEYVTSHGLLLSTEEWLGVLSLANKWNYGEVRKLAIQFLDNLLPLDGNKIRLGIRYQVDTWVKDTYYEFVSKAGLQIDELAQGPNNFDKDTIAKIFYIRSESLAHYGGVFCEGNDCRYTHTASCTRKRNGLKNARELIDATFKDDIASAYYNSDTPPPDV